MSLKDLSKESLINTQEFLPLREPTFFILLSLARSKQHGYAILKAVEEMSEGKITLSNGTLYGALTRLQDQGLIRRVELEEEQNNRLRKAYELTRDGLLVLNAETARLQKLLSTVQLQLSGEVFHE